MEIRYLVYPDTEDDIPMVEQSSVTNPKYVNTENVTNEDGNGNLDGDELIKDPNGLLDGEYNVNRNYIKRPGMLLNYFCDSGVDFEMLKCTLTVSQVSQLGLIKKLYPERLEKLSKQELDKTKPYAQPDDFTFVRFLQADDFCVDKSLNRLIHTVCWRQQHNIEDFAYGAIPPKMDVYHTYRIRRLSGVDKEGRPLVIDGLGESFSVSGLMGKMQPEEWLQCYCYDIQAISERCRMSSIENGKVITSCTAIMDMKGFKLFPFMRNINFIRFLGKEVEQIFPEQAGPIIFVNVPSTLPRVWNVIRRFVDPNTAAKFSFHKKVPYEYLKEVIDESYLPKYYGGTADQ